MKHQFKKTKVLLPVIHVCSEEQVMRNVQKCLDVGIEGVFLIMGEPEAKLRLAKKIQSETNLWVGINFLEPPLESFRLLKDQGIDGLWTDNAHIFEVETTAAQEAQSICQQENLFDGMYFGGVAFKYQDQPEDLYWAAKAATSYMDVVTTSGVGTRFEPGLQKIMTMKSAIGDHPLAIASGIDATNVGQFLSYVDFFLVRSSFTDAGEHIVADKLKRLYDAINL